MPIKVRYDLEDTSSQNPISHGVSVLNAIVGMLGYQTIVKFRHSGCWIWLWNNSRILGLFSIIKGYFRLANIFKRDSVMAGLLLITKLSLIPLSK